MNIAPKQRWLICGIYAVGILGLSIMPASALDKTSKLFPHQDEVLHALMYGDCLHDPTGGNDDKVLHALMYGGWAVLLGWTLQRQMCNQPAEWMVGIVLMATAYGALMEVLQGSLIWIQRDCSWGDMLADLAGAILGVGLYALCARPRLCMPNVRK